ncbi:hypothetical protein RF11_05387 [Thelohanellus kitauei]|uniref:Uncharacterized protein n=1 Tax=Thelohanellus kitauei TaxID=669202 RepID=A0A0C2JF05_THEKT|nr:hypothetical protein RF11_05387 [Thelohanellus kitauei]
MSKNSHRRNQRQNPPGLAEIVQLTFTSEAVVENVKEIHLIYKGSKNPISQTNKIYFLNGSWFSGSVIQEILKNYSKQFQGHLFVSQSYCMAFYTKMMQYLPECIQVYLMNLS